MPRLTDYRLKKRFEALSESWASPFPVVAVDTYSPRRAAGLQPEDLTDADTQIAAVEAAFEDAGDITFTAPAPAGRYAGRTLKHQDIYLKGLEARMKALRAAEVSV